MFLRWKLYPLIFLLGCFAQGQDSGGSTNTLAIGQGVSSPTIFNVNLFSSGFTRENPVALAYQTGYRLTAAIDGTTSTSFGADVGVGDGQYGLALAAYSNGCDGCDAYIRGGLAMIWEPFALGVAIQEDVYTFGFLMNPNGLHRIGAVLEIENLNGSDNNGIGYGKTAFGLGYSLVMPQFSFSFDISNQSFTSSARSSDPILITPGVAVRVDMFSVSLSYDYYLSDTGNNFNNQVWVGVSADITSDLQVTFYGEYVDRWAIMGSYFF